MSRWRCPTPALSFTSLSVSRVRIYLDSRQGPPSLVCLGWLIALDESDREIYRESRNRTRGEVIGERGKQKKEGRRRREKKREELILDKKRRDHVLVSSSHTSPSRFGTLAKTLLRFKSVPFGKVPILPENPPKVFQRSRGIFLKSYVDFLLRQCFFLVRLASEYHCRNCIANISFYEFDKIEFVILKYENDVKQE